MNYFVILAYARHEHESKNTMAAPPLRLVFLLLVGAAPRLLTSAPHGGEKTLQFWGCCLCQHDNARAPSTPAETTGSTRATETTGEGM